MKLLQYLARNAVMTIMSLLMTALILAGCLYFYMAIQLPDVDTLKDMQLQIPLRIYTSDGQLMGEFGEMRRSQVTLDQVPRQLINAIVATEDQRFYDHPGVDPIGLVRAAKELLITGQKTQGASTITMQVARNFFLTRKKTFTRKINEILLALKINSTFSKEKILELYINKIYLGERAYGVAAAAEIYFGKSLNELSLPEIALIAGLPQAPSRDNPIANPEAAKDRRDHVLQRMLEDGYITRTAYNAAVATPINAHYHGPKITVNAPYVSEMVRNVVVDQFGNSAYTQGLKVYTTIDSHLQQLSNQSLHDGLIAYDQRHGYRGPEKNLGASQSTSQWKEQLASIPAVNGLIPAAVVDTDADDHAITVMLANGKTIHIPWTGLTWARPPGDGKNLGPPPERASDIVKPGNLIRVQAIADGQWKLSQIPLVEGAIVSINPNNGAILALTGGFDYNKSNFNRVIQATRQPGSNFKPFIYAAALAKGYTLATIINDAPIVVSGRGGNPDWRPENDEMKFYGPTRLRVGLVKSRNLVTVRLLQMIGMRYTLKYLENFGFDAKKLPHNLSLALGTADVTPMQMVTGYAVFANGGYRVTPYFIQQIKDSDEKVVYESHPLVVCPDCEAQQTPPAPNELPAPATQILPKNIAPRVIDADIAYLMTNALQDVIQEGTGMDAKALHRQDIAGKTGTTNNKTNAWFSGFNSNMVTTVWVGFDQMQSLYEYGRQAALPIWMEYMGVALTGQPEVSMSQPSNIVTVRIDPNTGLLATSEQKNAIFEIFRKQDMPTESHTANKSDSFNANDNADAQLF